MDFNISDPEIERHLRTFRLDSMYKSDETIYALRPDLTLAFVNQGWSKFAVKNGGEPAISNQWSVGTSIKEAIPKPLLPFFVMNFANCFETRSPWQHRYDCSSVDEQREFIMTTYPLGDRKGLLVVNSLYRHFPRYQDCHKPFEAHYRNQDGMIVQCVHCRRVNRAADDAVWDWVPDWLDAYPENMSHGFCQPCFGYYYPAGNPLQGGYPKIYRTIQ